MKKIITQDGSVSFYNEKIRDYYHSKSGAKEEAIEKHAKALGVCSDSVIYDICFGLGYNTAAALDMINFGRIYCFENDIEILKRILEIDADFKSYDIIKKFVKNYLEKKETVFEKNGIKLIMVFGDARDTIKEIDNKADFVFFDPFSPSKVPEMWTEGFFRDIKSKMKNKGKLSTYSYTKGVREDLEKAGFKVKKGPVVGGYRPSVIAI